MAGPVHGGSARLRGELRARGRLAGLWGSALVALAVFVFLELRGLRPALNQDTVRDLLRARGCIEQGLCHTPGVRTAFGLRQGVLWTELLRLAWWSGLRVTGITTLVRVLLALATASVYASARRLRLVAPWACAALFVVRLLPAIRYPTLVYSSMPPLPVALVYACVFDGVETGRVRSWALGGLFLGLAVDSHLTCALLLPCFVAALAATARAPAAAMGGALAAFLAALWIDSPEALALNARALAASGGAWTLAVALVAAALAGHAARPSLGRVDGASRVLLVTWLHLATFGALLLGGALLTGHFIAERYLTPALPALCFGALLVVEWVAQLPWAHRRLGLRDARRSAAAAAVALSVALTWLLPGRWSPLYDNPVDWLLVESRAVAEQLYAAGWTWPTIHQRLQGPLSRDLVSALGLFEPRPGRGAAPTTHDLSVVRGLWSMSPPGLPPGGSVVPLGGDAFAVVRRFRSVLDRSAIRVCTADDPGCVDASVEPADPSHLPRRAYPLVLTAFQRPRPPAPRRLETTYVFQVAVPADGRDRVLTLCTMDRWRFTRSEGLLVRGAFPSREVLLDASRAQRGTLSITLLGATSLDAQSSWPPELLETEADERSLWRYWGERALHGCSWPSERSAHLHQQPGAPSPPR